MKKRINENLLDTCDEVSKYGEFVSTYFAWVPLDKQREIVEKLEEITWFFKLLLVLYRFFYENIL